MAASLASTPYPVNARGLGHDARTTAGMEIGAAPPPWSYSSRTCARAAGHRAVEPRDIGIADGCFERIAPVIDTALAPESSPRDRSASRTR